jgi:HSP20 family protein
MDLLLHLRSGAVWDPNADVVLDDCGRIVVRVELAGADSESLRVFADARTLFISGRRAQTALLSGGTYVQKEIAHGEFVKKVRLPAQIASDDVTATYSDGMLTIALPVAAAEFVPASSTEIRMIVKRTLA